MIKLPASFLIKEVKMDKLILNQLVDEKLKYFKSINEDKVAYNYAYPITSVFAPNSLGASNVEKITVSGSQLFIFNQINFVSTGAFKVLLKDVATGRELSESAISSTVLSDKYFYNEQRGIWLFDIPKIISGNGELNIILYNDYSGSETNTIKMFVKGVSINNR